MPCLLLNQLLLYTSDTHMDSWWISCGVEHIIEKHDFKPNKGKAFLPNSLVCHLESKSSCLLHYGVLVYIREL